MKRYTAILASILAVVGVVTGVFAVMGKGQAMQIRLNKRDLPKHGLNIISSIDPSFEETVAAYFKGRLSKKPPENLMSFSIFIKNSGNKKVVAYALVWQLVKTDGKVVENRAIYAEPGILMGDEMPNHPAFKHTVAIEPNAVRCFSWDSQIRPEAEYELGGLNSSHSHQGVGKPNPDSSDIRARLTTELSQATDVTVSLDGVFFEDGSFIGPNMTGFFERMQAIVSAKVDLLRYVAEANEQSRLDQELDAISAKSLASDIVLGSESTPSDYYKYYQKLYAAEITNMKGAFGKDRLVARLVDSYKRAPRLRKD